MATAPETIHRVHELTDRHREVLDEFARRRDAGRYRGLPAHLAAYDDPYVVRHELDDIVVDVLVANENAAIWYEGHPGLTDGDLFGGELAAARAEGVLAPGAVVFDAGAHHGMMSVYFAIVAGPEGHVHAFEPSLISGDLVELNARLNGLDNITLHRALVGNVTGRAPFNERAARTGFAGFDDGEVDAVRLDDLAHLRPTLIKIDVEGYEAQLFAGAQKVLESTPNLMLEVHSRPLVEAAGSTHEEILAAVDWARYDVFLAVGKPTYELVDEPAVPDAGGWVAARRRPTPRPRVERPAPRAKRRWLRRAEQAVQDPDRVAAGGLTWDLAGTGDDAQAADLRAGRMPGGVLSDTVIELAPEGGRVLDLGAHLGTVALRAAAHGARVLALTGEPNAAEALRRSAPLNQLDVAIVHGVAATGPGTVTYSVCGPWSHVRKVTEIDDVDTAVTVPTVRASDVLAERGWDGADVVKLTQAGYELPALAGLPETGVPLLVLELNAHALTWYGETELTLRDALRARGYEPYLVDARNRMRLIPFDEQAVVTECVGTLVATTDPARLGAFTIAPLTSDETRDRLVDGLAHPATTDRWNAVRQLERRPDLRDDERVAAALARVQLDPDGMVRDAAAWAAEAQWGADRGEVGDGPRSARVEVDGVGTLDFEIPAGPADGVSAELIERGVEPPYPPNRLVRTLTRPGMRFLDVGTHIGTFSLPAAARGAEVLGVDAHPGHVAALTAAAERNGLADRVSVVHAAAADAPGELDLVLAFGWSHVSPPDGELDSDAGAHRVTVPARPLREIVAEHGWDRIDVLKMDIEGSEVRALAGIGDLLDGPDAPDVVIEVNPPNLLQQGTTPRVLFEALEDRGYRLLLLEQSEDQVLVPIRPDVFLSSPADDVLAVKRVPDLPGWRIASPLTRHDQAVRAVQVARSPFRMVRGVLAASLMSAPGWLVDDPLIREALRALRNDVDPFVRDSAAWSA